MSNLSKRYKALLLLIVIFICTSLWLFSQEIGESLADSFGDAPPAMKVLSDKDASLIRDFVLRPTPVVAKGKALWNAVELNLLPHEQGTLVQLQVAPSNFSDVWPQFRVEMLGHDGAIVRSFVVSGADYAHPSSATGGQRTRIEFVVRIHPGEKNLRVKVIS